MPAKPWRTSETPSARAAESRTASTELKLQNVSRRSPGRSARLGWGHKLHKVEVEDDMAKITDAAVFHDRLHFGIIRAWTDREASYGVSAK
jgi:hypothetical protein